MPNGIVRLDRRRCDAVFAGMFGVAFERAADEVTGAKTHGERQREDDAAEQDAKGQFNHMAPDLEVVENHGRCQHEYEPLDAKRKETCVFKLRIHSFDKDRSRKETREERSCNEQQDGAYDTGKVRQQ